MENPTPSHDRKALESDLSLLSREVSSLQDEVLADDGLCYPTEETSRFVNIILNTMWEHDPGEQTKRREAKEAARAPTIHNSKNLVPAGIHEVRRGRWIWACYDEQGVLRRSMNEYTSERYARQAMDVYLAANA